VLYLGAVGKYMGLIWGWSVHPGKAEDLHTLRQH
jgi:hypothetical protein